MKLIADNRHGLRSTAFSCLAIALIASALAFAGGGAATAQEPVTIQEDVTAQGESEPSCEPIDLGMLENMPGSSLSASGTWTTQDCDSRFRADSDAHTYRFELDAPGRIRIDLKSSDADSYLYLLDGEGNRISEVDDGSVGRLDARIERQLGAGTYMVEATTTAGRVRGPADFEVVVSQATGCDPVPLGTLTPGQDLEAVGSWTDESCQSIFLTGHPSQYFAFSLPQGARVRIELKSEGGDPVLIVAPLIALQSVAPGQVAHNDDVDGTRNSRVEQYLPPETYGIEATTYRSRDLQGPSYDFTLTLSIVDEEAHQRRPLLKIEDIDIPDEVVAGDPLPINFRVGNVGGDEFPDPASNALLYAIGPRVFDRAARVPAHLWPAGVAYHTNEETASATSSAAPEVTPHSVTFSRTGSTWVFTAVITYDGDNNELGFHGLWHDLTVLSGPTYGPVLVEVDGEIYSVSADADGQGEVTTTVASVADPAAEVDTAIHEKAQYAAGVRTQLFDGIFERPAISGLAESAEPVEVALEGPSSSALLKTAAPRYAALVRESGLLETLASGEAVSPVAVENLVLTMADGASGTYAFLADSWRALSERVESGGALSFDEATDVQSQLAYVERVIAPVISAGKIVTAARAAEQGWDDPDVQAMLSTQPSCDTGDDPLRDPLELAGLEDADSLVALDTEVRAALFAYIVAIDSVLCTVPSVDAANSRFLERLGLDQSEQLLALIEPDAPVEPEEAPAPEPALALRILARLGDDGRVEYGVELADGSQILPDRRFMPAEARTGAWYSSDDVVLDDGSLGQVRARRLADGRTELGFRLPDGGTASPDIAHMPADPDEGVWYRSSLLEVPPPQALEAGLLAP